MENGMRRQSNSVRTESAPSIGATEAGHAAYAVSVFAVSNGTFACCSSRASSAFHRS
jgi:hypothetical protein